MQQIIIQVFMAMLGVIGFSIMLNIHGYKVFIITVGGAVCWIAYIIIFNISNDKMISYFITTVIMAAISEVLARICKTPVILLLVPMIVPLIPGSDLYYMMFHLILGNAEDGRTFGYLLAKEAGAIGFGIIIVTTVTQIILVIHKNVKEWLMIKCESK
jgi:uncharacterized membrane protein YjjB (DUF3815 family)